ncbi:MAG TPA: hypothetical protein PKW90_22850, partial [Myxococcota bacterium]|nr:hypothetical protein [Myxococcota bacterium]
MLLLLAGCTAPSPDSTDPTGVDSVVDSPADSAIDSEELPGYSFDLPDFSAALPGEKNHLLPLKTAVDSRSRRAFVVSEALGTVAVVDLDSQEVLKVLQLGTGGKADVVADG